MAEIKKPTTYEEQLDILQSRGILIEDSDACIRILENVNYYRLTAYFLPFKEADGSYRRGTSFLTVYRIYEFDRKLRRILFSALEEVEVSLRAKFAYYHAHKYDALGYLEASNFSSKHNHERFLEQIEREVESNKNVPFVRHHLSKYDGYFPIWVITELFTFGMVSRFYADMVTADQKYLSRRVYGTTPGNVISWLRCCTDLRNICAHYGRLYYRIFPAVPAGFQNEDERTLRRLWGTMLALKGLFMEKEKWNGEFIRALSALFEEYADVIDLRHIGFPADWEQQLTK